MRSILNDFILFGVGCFCGYVNGLHRGRRQAEEKYFEEYVEQDQDQDDENIYLNETDDDII